MPITLPTGSRGSANHTLRLTPVARLPQMSAPLTNVFNQTTLFLLILMLY